MTKIQETYRVHGMSCTGCEAALEEALLPLDGVFEAQSDFKKGEVLITYDPAKISFKDLESAVSNAGYSIEPMNPVIMKEKEPHPQKPLSPGQMGGILLGIIALFLLIQQTVGFNNFPEIPASVGYGALFVIGLMTSLHCVAMCGGINLSVCAQGADSKGGGKSNLMPSFLYNSGRLVSYTILGALIGGIGSVIGFTGWGKGLIAILSGVFMIMMGLSLSGLFPWVNRVIPKLPKGLRTYGLGKARGKGAFVVGILNGLMPCGPLQMMQVYALGTGSAVAGALSMLFFCLGTIPLMFLLGAAASTISPRLTKKVMVVSALLISLLGIVMVGRGLALSGGFAPSMMAKDSAEPSVSQPIAPGDSSVQQITSVLTDQGYPNISVKKGVPVVWNLKATKETLTSCNEVLVIPPYNLRVKLNPGDNIIRFTPSQTGTIGYSCWMGMQTGTIQVLDGSGEGTSSGATDPSPSVPAPSKPSSGMPCCSGVSPNE